MRFWSDEKDPETYQRDASCRIARSPSVRARSKGARRPPRLSKAREWPPPTTGPIGGAFARPRNVFGHVFAAGAAE